MGFTTTLRTIATFRTKIEYYVEYSCLRLCPESRQAYPTTPSQWRYINTARNPVDLATRCVLLEKLVGLEWVLNFYEIHLTN